jgi:transposase-like protein
MPAPHPPEFRQRAVELARLRDKPIRLIAKDLEVENEIPAPGRGIFRPGLCPEHERELVVGQLSRVMLCGR